MANIGIGGKEQAEMETKNNTEKAENSQTSQKKEKRNTTKTSKLTRVEILEILNQSFFMCQEEGIPIDVSENDNDVTITVHNVKFIDGILRPIETEAE